MYIPVTEDPEADESANVKKKQNTQTLKGLNGSERRQISAHYAALIRLNLLLIQYL